MPPVAQALPTEAALAYAERHALHALAIARRGRLMFETYGATYAPDSDHPLFSGTKSFWGVLAAAAHEDGILALDEQVARTITEWETEARKELVTIRDLLQLTAGFGFGGLGSAVPSAEKAIATPLKTMPGATFTYGGIPLQIFGEALRRKLASRDLSPHDYLRERIFEPIGLRVASWRKLKDGTHPLPTGAFLTAQEWLKFGQLVLERGHYKGKTVVSPHLFSACFEGSNANPRYGLGFWLSPLPELPDVVYASGSGGQALYVIPSQETVVVHFGSSSSWKHETFLRKLLLVRGSRKRAR
jgi:CubicO group peptidase (beta-lactamase class C family)